MSDLECPYCYNTQDYNDDGTAEDEEYEFECSKCYRIYRAVCNYTVSYSTTTLEEELERSYKRLARSSAKIKVLEQRHPSEHQEYVLAL